MVCLTGMKYLTGILLFFLFSCSAKGPELVKESKRLSFSTLQRVVVAGYTGHLMEPFISRDGRWLFFNDLNDPSVNTNIFYAERISDTLFQFAGEVGGLNSPYLDGVASMDNAGNLYFITTRSYPQDFSTVYRGVFNNGTLTATEIVNGISLQQPGWVDFDVEISADGQTLYFSEGRFNQTGQPQTADILVAKRTAHTFTREAAAGIIPAYINTDALEYAAGISADELTLYFTRWSGVGSGTVPRLYYATRENKALPFDSPHLINEAEGFTEAVSAAGNGLLYFHKRDTDTFHLYCMKRL